MKKLTVFHYDAFTDTPNKGNPAGIIIDGDGLTEGQMQEIACKVGFNESAFVIKSENEHLRLRYFTPGHEMPLCGHATIAALSCLREQGQIRSTGNITVETKAGILKMKLFISNNRYHVLMEQTQPVFKPFSGQLSALAALIGLSIEDLDTRMPVLYGSTGTWTLLIPVKKLEAFSRMKPQSALFPELLPELPHSSIHPFCLETINPKAHMHGRHFSSPFSGTIEDPVTGTASGVMGAYYLTYIASELKEAELLIEQGSEIDREGIVRVYVKKQEQQIHVAISGTAVFHSEAILEIS